jgi:hypothetical protein
MMNGRIRKLIRDQDLEIGSYYWTDEEKERFAQRIIEEANDLFEVEYGQSEVSGNDVARVLKQHFGVE